MVARLSEALKAEGAEVWFDQDRLLPGQEWAREVMSGLRTSDVIVICLSSRSVRKEGFVQREIREALDIAKEKPPGTIAVIPILLDECEPPSELRPWQWLDYSREGAFDLLALSLAKRANDLGASFPWSATPESDARAGRNREPGAPVAVPRAFGARQKITRRDACPTRAVRAEVTLPKAALVCWPVAVLNVAEVFTPENWV